MPLVISSFGGGHIDTQINTHISTCHGKKQFLKTRCAAACGQHMHGLKITAETVLEDIP